MKNKVIIVILIVIIAIGLVFSLSGFNLGLRFGTARRLDVDFDESFEIKDVESMARDVFGDTKLKVNYIDEFKAGVSITLANATDEQILEFENKLKEKYSSFAEKKDEEENKENTENAENSNETDENKNDEEDKFEFISVTEIPSAKLYDLIRVYVKPLVITSILVIIFLAIVFRKLGIAKAIGLPIGLILIINALYISVVAILHIPVNEFTIGLGMFIYVASLLGTTLYMKQEKAKYEKG